ncbi:MAG: DUF305 domain-containing protein [Candidatus Eremiobacteraeota bacterium]|nr:DUF305 domain-containing protein [Candidatus Eremiobacteraeota bacterium]MBC5808749.1 DUF305 domain-containing protein [Candidatus Eremiobacteraeota bacterium]
MGLLVLAGIGIGMVSGRILDSGAAHAMPMMSQKSMSCHMPQSKSPGDEQMQRAMMTMMSSNRSMTLTGDQDRDFMRMMIPHHEAAIAMARVESSKGKRQELRSVAHDIIASQQKEIRQMRAWLHEWYGE